MKIIEKMRIILLSVAVLAINVHMMIPHDHHQADSFQGQDRDCPVSGNTGNHHSGVLVHCHACNDLAPEKSVILIKVIHFECKYFLTGDNIYYKNPDLHLTGFVENYLSVNLPGSDYPELGLLRAPPSLV
jgi:hypothetical protein